MRFRYAKLQSHQIDAEALYLAVALSAAVLWIFFKKQLDFILFCPFKVITGIPCPTCGFVRTFTYISHGQFKNAFALSPLFAVGMVVAFILFAYSLTVVVFRLPRLRVEFSKKRSIRVLIIVMMVIFVLNWIWSIYKGL